MTEIELKLKVKEFGTFTRFNDVFQFLMNLSVSGNFSLIIDEFQEVVFVLKNRIAMFAIHLNL